MLHLLAYRYVYAKKSEDQERLAVLKALGRACGWAFRESQRAGQALVVSATEALRSSYAFPADEIRQGHLGFLLTWLESEGGNVTERWDLAREREEQPIATSLRPALERDDLQPALEQFHEARDQGDRSSAETSRQRIHDLLAKELTLRIGLVKKALAVLQADPRPINLGCESLVATTLEEQFDQFVKIESALAQGERAFVADPDTDRGPAAAASRYNRYVAASDEHVHALVHHDHAMQMEEVEAGNGIRGQLVGVEDLGTGRKRRPIWTVQDNGKTSLRLREGSDVCVAGISGRVGRIREIAPQPDGTRLFTIEITKGKTNRLKGFANLLPAHSEDLIGETVILLATSYASLGYQRAQMVWRQDGPGAWLTHAKGR
jgi:hypothetical protein